MTKIITFANQKGGVGKTTLAVNVAVGLAKTGRLTLVIDADPQGQVAEFLGRPTSQSVFNVLLEASDINDEAMWIGSGPYLLAGNKRTAAAAAALTAEGKTVDHIYRILRRARSEENRLFDYIIIDTSPSVGGLQEMATWAADYVIIPTEAASASLHGLSLYQQSLNNLKRTHDWRGSVGGIVPMKVDSRTVEDRLQLDSLRQAFGDLVTPPIHASIRFKEATAHGQSIFDYATVKSDGSSKRALDEMAKIVWWVRDLP